MKYKIRDKEITFVNIWAAKKEWEQKLDSHEWDESYAVESNKASIWEDYVCIRCQSVIVQERQFSNDYYWPDDYVEKTCNEIVMKDILE